VPDQIPFEDDRVKAFRSQANRNVALLIKRRARAYAGRPRRLDNVYPDLSEAAPEDMIAVATALLSLERSRPKRWFGFGAEVHALNERAILLLGRARRKYAWRTASQPPDGLGAKSTA
jgi:hypothetical protein